MCVMSLLERGFLFSIYSYVGLNKNLIKKLKNNWKVCIANIIHALEQNSQHNTHLTIGVISFSMET
jgi:hypothetical protein